MRQIATGLAITIFAALLSVGGWMLVFIQFAIVPDGTAYPQGWTSLTSGEQVEWLRTHTVVLSGFEGSVYMLKHFSKYAAQFVAMFMMTWISAAIAVGAWWHLERKDVDEGANVERYAVQVQDKDR